MIPPDRKQQSTFLPGLGLLALLALAWWIYAPGLSGAFLFDDWANLPSLGAHGPIDTWRDVVTYLLSGIASSTGRPVAMLSFLLDANNWPAAPEPFKYTNILIHILNGALLTWLTLRLTRLLGIEGRRAAWTAILGAGMWLLHPLMVSTTLFVVQRMAMLAATFVIAGLLCYLHGRTLLSQERRLPAYLWMSAGAGLCGLLATLSKENGALFPLFVLLVEKIVVQHPNSPLRMTRSPTGWWIWQGIFIYLPLGILATYLLAHLPSMIQGYADARNFTLSERLLTEGRIVARYLYLLWVPHSFTGGLYNDDIVLSTDLLHPWTTLPALLLIAGLLALAWRLRRTQPAIALAIFFYFSGHILESTFIPLELYFEHRNYLPAILLFWPVAVWLAAKSPLKTPGKALVGILLLGLLAGLTWTRADLWGKPFKQAVVWARQSPDSPRAQTTLALHLMHRERYKEAAQILEHALQQHPDNIMININLLSARCSSGGVTEAQLSPVRRALSRAKVGNQLVFHAISRLIRHYKDKRCPGVGPKQLDSLISATLNNPQASNHPGWRQDMLTLRGELMLSEHRLDEAMALFKRSLAAWPRPEVALYQSSLLGTAGYPAAGVVLLDYYATLPKQTPTGFNIGRLKALWLGEKHYYTEELARVRALLVDDTRSQGRITPPSSQNTRDATK